MHRLGLGSGTAPDHRELPASARPDPCRPAKWLNCLGKDLHIGSRQYRLEPRIFIDNPRKRNGTRSRREMEVGC